MKKLLLSLTLVGALTLPAFLSGCRTTPIANANSANALLITSVNTGMTTWAAYVNGGNATQAQINAVKNAYNTYYNAELILKGVLEQAINSTNTVATTSDIADLTAATNQAETALLNLLNQYLLKK